MAESDNTENLEDIELQVSLYLGLSSELNLGPKIHETEIDWSLWSSVPWLEIVLTFYLKLTVGGNGTEWDEFKAGVDENIDKLKEKFNLENRTNEWISTERRRLHFWFRQ